MNKQKKINIYRKARKLRFLKYIPFAKSINNMIANMKKEKQEERSYEYKCKHPDNPEWREK